MQQILIDTQREQSQIFGQSNNQDTGQNAPRNTEKSNSSNFLNTVAIEGNETKYKSQRVSDIGCERKETIEYIETEQDDEIYASGVTLRKSI